MKFGDGKVGIQRFPAFLQVVQIERFEWLAGLALDFAVKMSDYIAGMVIGLTLQFVALKLGSGAQLGGRHS
jgi:hypothetical protein